jgi:hypothetical protein
MNERGKPDGPVVPANPLNKAEAAEAWEAYGQGLEANLADLHQRVHRGSFRATPSRRVYIPKADGRLRPLGIAALEDKVVSARRR